MNIKDAIRRTAVGSYRRVEFPIASRVALPDPNPVDCSFREALDGRRSADRFSLPTMNELSSFLKDVFGIRSIDRSDPNRQKRPVASMGALHPAYLLLHLGECGWSVYLPTEHCLGQLYVQAQSSERLIGLVEQHMPMHGGAIICLLSDCDLAANYYLNYVPLLFRDAGVLLGHASLVAAAHRLAFRILGRTGTKIAESLVPGIPFTPLATGLALLGSSEENFRPQPVPVSL